MTSARRFSAHKNANRIERHFANTSHERSRAHSALLRFKPLAHSKALRYKTHPNYFREYARKRVLDDDDNDENDENALADDAQLLVALPTASLLIRCGFPDRHLF